jgi:plastocyanin
LLLTSGPSPRITLRTAAGRAVTRLGVGSYTVAVRDRSRLHNARIVAPGVRRATTVPFVGRATWRVRLARPGTLRFLCDPHASQGMRGSARIVR